VDHREDLVGERTRMQSRLRWHVHELFPGLEIAPKSLGRLHVIAALDRRLHEVDGTLAAIARELLVRIRDLTVRINELQGRSRGSCGPSLRPCCPCQAAEHCRPPRSSER
jgi:transposase